MSSDRFRSQEEARAAERDGAPEAEEGAFRAPVDRGESVGDPDVQLDVPVLNVDEIELEVDDLRARVSFQAELADMVKINVGIDAEVGKAKIDIQGVEAQAQLKARLDNVRAIFSQVLAALERDPDLAQNMLRSSSSGIANLLGGDPRAQGGPAQPPEQGPAGEPEEAQKGSEEAGSLADLPIEEEYVDEQGRLIGRARDGSGRVVEAEMDDEGNVLRPRAQDEQGPEATDAARRRAEELGVDLSEVRGTGSGGRILVRDVEKVGNAPS